MTPGTTKIIRQQVKPEDNNCLVHRGTVKFLSSLSWWPALANVSCKNSKLERLFFFFPETLNELTI